MLDSELVSVTPQKLTALGLCTKLTIEVVAVVLSSMASNAKAAGPDQFPEGKGGESLRAE